MHTVGADLRYERVMTRGFALFAGVGADLTGFFIVIPVGDYHVHAGAALYPMAAFDQLFIQLGAGYAFEAANNDVSPAVVLGNVGWKFSITGPLYLKLGVGYVLVDQASNPTIGIAAGCQF